MKLLTFTPLVMLVSLFAGWATSAFAEDGGLSVSNKPTVQVLV